MYLSLNKLLDFTFDHRGDKPYSGSRLGVAPGLQGGAVPQGKEDNMSTLTFTDDMARIQRAVAQCHDLVLRRGRVLEALQLRTGERVLEVGCGGGFYTSEVAQWVGPTGQVCAIDLSGDQIAAAQRHCAEWAWVTCRVADAAAVPYDDGAFDVVYGVQVFEYVTQLDTALHEVQRVLR